ncbi:hypothetical protein Taro_049662 [Colocasia esculenta]|uniref:Uncharacterized protein n=1 Tax=Colocasia esculenta TaxID=4460 RepID=A0A843XBM4_COLES|nr:hypothetical protein [Colocasia esculenta]
MRQHLLGHKESRQRRPENEAEISEELSGRLNKRARRDDDDEPGSEDLDLELTKAIEHERATRLRGKTPIGGSGSRGNTDATPQRAGPMDSYQMLGMISRLHHVMKYTDMALRERSRSSISGLKTSNMDAYRMRIEIYSDSQLQYVVGRVNPDEPRDPEFRVPTKRPRASPPSSKGKQPENVENIEEQSELELAQYSKSDSRPITPTMVKPPPSLRRTTSGIYITKRASATARDDLAFEKIRQIYVRRMPRGKGLHTQMQEMDQLTEKKKESKTGRRRLVSYNSKENDDDDDPSAIADTTTSDCIYT